MTDIEFLGIFGGAFMILFGLAMVRFSRQASDFIERVRIALFGEASVRALPSVQTPILGGVMFVIGGIVLLAIDIASVIQGK